MRFNDIIEEDFENLFEMANLQRDITGIDGIIYISAKSGKHGPRVKYYSKSGAGQPSFSVSISNDHVLLASSMKTSIVNRYLPLVQQFVELNYTVLIDIWNRSHSMSSDELRLILTRIKKIK